MNPGKNSSSLISGNEAELFFFVARLKAKTPDNFAFEKNPLGLKFCVSERGRVRGKMGV